MKRLIAIAAAIALLFTLSVSTPVAAQTVWHVDDDGMQYPSPDFNTIQVAIGDPSIVAGDTIIVHEGTYTENVWVDKDDLTIKAADGKNRPLVDGGTGPAFIIAANGVTVEGFNAKSTNVHVIHINPPSEGVMIHDNEVSGSYGDAIMVYGSANTIKGNYVHHSLVGIGLNEVSNNQVLDNIITDVGSVGIQLWDSHVNMVVGNQVDAAGAESCIGVTMGSSGNTIVENELSNGAVGVSMYTAEGNYVLENRISGSDTGISVNMADCNHIFENTITHARLWGIWLVDESDNNIIKENKVRHSGEYDLYSDGSGTGNIWKENKYKRSHPDSLQSP